ncbi:MAG: hypothetical protein AAF333_08545 [Planctomycetota bacterium]
MPLTTHLLNPDEALALVSAPASEALPRALASDAAAVAMRVLAREADRQRFFRSESQFAESGVRDFEFGLDARDADPDAVFDRLRWGGQFVFVSPDPDEVSRVLEAYRGKPEWVIELETATIVQPRRAELARRLSWVLPERARRRWFESRRSYAVVRKVLLDPISRLTARHSYDVRLVRARGKVDRQYATDGMVVLKRVPTMAQAIDRLRQTCPEVPPDRLGEIAAKLVRKVFPIFLTREAAFLKLLQRDLPPELKLKTPRVLSMETDEQGLVRAMSLRWLRQGGPPLSQTEFARQSAELVRALHERVGIMHLDLRLDNMLVTDHGVAIVDFGSSVRVGEDFSENPLLDRLLREMLTASQITRDLSRQRGKKLIRAAVFDGLPYPPTTGFDLFALTTNMTRPHDNAELKGLVRHDKLSDEGKYFSRLRKRILQPADDEPHPIIDLHALCLELGLKSPRPAAAPPPPSTTKPVILSGPSLPRRGRATPKPKPQPETAASAGGEIPEVSAARAEVERDAGAA